MDIGGFFDFINSIGVFVGVVFSVVDVDIVFWFFSVWFVGDVFLVLIVGFVNVDCV